MKVKTAKPMSTREAAILLSLDSNKKITPSAVLKRLETLGLSHKMKRFAGCYLFTPEIIEALKTGRRPGRPQGSRGRKPKLSK